MIKGILNTWVRKWNNDVWYLEIAKKQGQYKLTVRGSLHKFYHDDNKGKFTGIEVLSALDGMIDLFEIDPSRAKVHYIEVGINVKVPFHVYKYLNSNLLYHKKKYRKQMNGKEGFGFHFMYEEDYQVKIYMKEQNTLRFEIKYFSKDKLKLFRIECISDITQGTIISLAESLQPEWSEIISKAGISTVFNKHNPLKLNDEEQTMFLYFTSEIYQIDYKVMVKEAANRKKKDALRQEYYRLYKYCMSIISRGDKHHARIANLIVQDVESLKNSFEKSKVMSRIPVTIRNGKRDKEANSK